LNLSRVLKKYDRQADGVHLEDLPENVIFKQKPVLGLSKVKKKDTLSLSKYAKTKNNIFFIL